MVLAPHLCCTRPDGGLLFLARGTGEDPVLSRPLPDDKLKVIIGMLDASPGGAIQGSAALWMQMVAGGVERIGHLGAVESLCNLLVRPQFFHRDQQR
eukprot:3140120-Prymnesium_polylepis.1